MPLITAILDVSKNAYAKTHPSLSLTIFMNCWLQPKVQDKPPNYCDYQSITLKDKAILALAVASNPNIVQRITYRIRTAVSDINKTGGISRAKKLIDEYYEKARNILRDQVQVSVTSGDAPLVRGRLNAQIITTSEQLIQSQKPLLAIIESFIDQKVR